MKLKKVEIQAFRAYQKKENGTFNFSLENNECANFVSIYAPNGFGKTSFYDAVEWAMTKNIHRFIRRDKVNKEVAKSEQNINSKRQYILRNKNAAFNLNCEVKVHLNTGQVVTNSIKANSTAQTDYRFDTKKTERSYFKKVILSQEWIDAFLKEESGHERYKTFVEYFGDKQLDNYFKDVTGLINYTEQQITQCKDQLNGLQLTLAYDGDHNILSRVNGHIATLRQKEINIRDIDSAFASDQTVDVKNTVSSEKNRLEFEIRKDSEKVTKIIELVNGVPGSISLAQYFELKERLKSLHGELEVLHAAQKAITDYDTQKRKKEAILENLLGTKQKLASLRKLESHSEDYFAKRKTLEDSEKERGEANGLLLNSNRDFLKLETELNSANIGLATTLKQIDEIILKLGQIPPNQGQATELESKIAEIADKISIASEEISKQESELRKSEAALRQEERNIENVKARRYLDLPRSNETMKSLPRLREIETELKIADTRLSDLEKKINANLSYKTDIEALLIEGRKITQTLNKPNCPLCLSPFKTLEELLERINTNPVLSKEIQDLSEQITNAQDSKDRILEEETSLQQTLRRHYQSLVTSIRSDIEKVTDLLNVAKKTLELLEIDRKAHSANREVILSFFTGKSAEQLELELRVELDAKNKTKSQTLELISEKTVLRTAEDIKRKILTENLDTLERNIKELQSDLENSQFSILFSTIFPEQLTIAPTTITEELKMQLKLEEIQSKELGEADIYLNELSEKLSPGRTLSDLSIEVSQKEADISLATGNAGLFETSLSIVTDRSIPLSELKSSLDSMSALIDTVNTRKTENEKLISELNLLSELIDNVTPYLTFVESKKTEQNLELRVKFLNETVLPL